MGEIKRVNGQILRKELKEMEKMHAEYDTLQDKRLALIKITKSPYRGRFK